MDEDRRGQAQYGSLRTVVVQAIEEARLRGSTSVEAEDLLLALASCGTTETKQSLERAGLDHESILRALRDERRHSLAQAGIEAVDDERLVATPRTDRPSWGTSVREAVSRGRSTVNRNRNRRAAETDVLVGILLANFGTVPRALTLAGIDRDALIGRLQRERRL